MRIGTGAHVEIHYELLDETGACLETTRDEEPVRYVHGEEEILPGLEAALAGHAAGERIRVTLPAAEAYGEYAPEGLVSLPRAEIDATDEELAPGAWITVAVTETEDAVDGELEMRVVEVDGDEVILDANHPLAGRKVTFVVEVVSVSRPAEDGGGRGSCSVPPG
ncbi:MAG: FKBP-type peptidyl-prolyl cis-trans isomerase [Planctomycetota bacterium]